MYQDIIDDQDNGLSEEQRDRFREYIKDRDQVKEDVKEVKEGFANGDNNDTIKENLASNIADSQNSSSTDTTKDEFAFNNFDELKPDSYNNVYLSPAGIPVRLPAGAIPRFSSKKELGIPRGVLVGFTLKNGELPYSGYTLEGRFTGYKQEKGDKPYVFEKVSISGNIEVIIGLKTPYLDCGNIFLQGLYTPKDFNETGEGALLTGKQIQFIGQAEGLSELSIKYTHCLPDVSRISYDKYIFGYYNYFDQNGFLRIVINTSGGISYIYSVSDNEGNLDSYHYNPGKGKWYRFNEPPFDCLSCDLKKMFAALYDPSAVGHFTLDAIGMVPLLGETADAINGVWYLVEGDGVNATISFVSTIPLVYATSAKYVGRIIKVAKNSYISVRFGVKESRAFLEKLKQLDFDEKLIKRLDQDLIDKGFAEAIAKNPELVNAWKRIDDQLGDAGELIRKNPEALKQVDDAIKEGLDATDAIEDAIQTLGKSKPTWPEIQALFKRGNDFNAKGRLKYKGRYSEIVLKGVNGKVGKRLDTYIPPSNGKAGEIISRKATTLSEILPNTFKNYLNELITKYPKGAELNSSKFPPGTKLDGDYFLEIPSSNKSFFESSTEFQKVLSDFNTAKGVDIKIKYLTE